jgi:filamentous hemagglutinin
MTQQVIQVGAQPNDGEGTPLRNSFIITNENFTELYARAQTTPPTTLVGQTGDQAGWYAYDSNYFYYCFADYDGSSIIWAQVSQIGNVTVTNIQNGTSNVKITNINGNVTTGVAGFGNVVTVASTGQYVTGVISALGNVTGSYILGNGSQLTGLPATYTNSNVTTLLSNFGSNTISSAGNITAANVNGAAIYSSGNVAVQSQISATGNIVTDQYFVGNFFGNVTGNFVIPGSNTQVVFNTSGNADATAGMTFNKDSNTFTVLGVVSSQGNVISGNVLTGGLISATANITGGNILTGGIVSSTGNTTAGNLLTSGLANVTGNITGGNISTGGIVTATGNVSSTGNVTGNYLRATLDVNAGGNVIAVSHTGTTVSVTGNIQGGNLRTAGIVSATGSITSAANIFANNVFSTTTVNAVSLTGTVASLSGNITGGNLLSSGLINITGNLNAGNLLTAGNVVGSNIAAGGQISATANVIGGNILTGGQVSATGNITAGNVQTGNVAAGNAMVTGNITGGNILTGGLISATANIQAGNLSVGSGTVLVGNIVNSNANATGNIGSSSNYFNTVFALATSAQYADLAENYLADTDYTSGTVVVFGGDKEITISTDVADERVAGAISTNPAHLMNAAMSGLPVALRGRVPVNVIGPVIKGDSLVTSSTAGHAQSVGRSRLYGQAVFAKSLETNLEDGKKIIIAVII